MENWFRRLLTKSSVKKPQPGASVTQGLVCQEVVELITDYLEGALLPEKRVLFEEHIADCPGCTNYMEQIQLTLRLLRNLAHEPVFPSTKEELLQVFRQGKKEE